jgi:hypothetical protein
MYNRFFSGCKINRDINKGTKYCVPDMLELPPPPPFNANEAVKAYEALIALATLPDKKDAVNALIAQLAVPFKLPVNDPLKFPLATGVAKTPIGTLSKNLIFAINIIYYKYRKSYL